MAETLVFLFYHSKIVLYTFKYFTLHLLVVVAKCVYVCVRACVSECACVCVCECVCE